MSAPPVPDQGNALQALPAADAGTEARLNSGQPLGPAYVDLSDGRAQRKPIAPGHLRDGDGLAGLYRGLRRHLHHQSVRHGHSTAYHSLRSPAMRR